MDDRESKEICESILEWESQTKQTGNILVFCFAFPRTVTGWKTFQNSLSQSDLNDYYRFLVTPVFPRLYLYFLIVEIALHLVLRHWIKKPLCTMPQVIFLQNLDPGPILSTKGALTLFSRSRLEIFRI